MLRAIRAHFRGNVVGYVALFVALSGSAYAAATTLPANSVGTRQLRSGAVTNAKLASGAVTGSKVANNSLTAADVAPNTFLAANGTAANSTQLDGMPASSFVHGTGNVLQHRIEITAGTSSQLLVDVGLGEIDGSCLAGVKPEISFTAEAQPLNLIEWGTTFPSSSDINTVNGLNIGSTYTEPNSSGVPQAIEFQVAQNLGVSVSPSRVATAWTTDQVVGTDCVFTAQALTTGV